MKRPYAVLFDLDGTLVDINPDEAELEDLRADLEKYALNAGVVLRARDIFGMYQDVLLSVGFDHPVSKQMRQDIDRFEIRWAYDRCVPKTSRLLGELRDNVQITGIVTSNGAACVQALYHSRKIKKEWFDLAVTRDESPLLKPSSVPLERAFNLATECAHDLSEIWFVGDSNRDKQAVEEFNRRARPGVTFARIGPSTEESAAKQSFTDLDDFIKELLRKR